MGKILRSDSETKCLKVQMSKIVGQLVVPPSGELSIRRWFLASWTINHGPWGEVGHEIMWEPMGLQHHFQDLQKKNIVFMS